MGRSNHLRAEAQGATNLRAAMRIGLRQEALTIIPEEVVAVEVSHLLEQTLLGRVTAAPTQEEAEEELRMEYEEKGCPAVHGDIDEGEMMCFVSFNIMYNVSV